MKNKYHYLIAMLWLASGYICWLAGDNLFISITSRSAEKLRLHLHTSLASTAFIVLILTDLIIIIAGSFLLSSMVGKRSIWSFLFIVGFIVPPMYSTIASNIEFIRQYNTLPPDATAVLNSILVKTVMAYLLIVPLAAYVGVKFGDKYRMRKAA
jgi:hypothetical protein